MHPDPNAGSIVDWLGAVDERVGSYEPASLVEYPDARTRYEIAVTWKIIVDNYIDVYHLSHLHSNTLQMYDHAKAQYGIAGPHFLLWEPPVPRYADKQNRNLSMPRVIPESMNGAWELMLFPGIGIWTFEDTWNTFIFTPLAPDRTRVETRIRVANVSIWDFAKQSLHSSALWAGFGTCDKYVGDDATGKDDPMASSDFTEEDIFACKQQKSLQSLWFEVGPASVGESPVTDHQKLVLTWMSGDAKIRTFIRLPFSIRAAKSAEWPGRSYSTCRMA